MRLGISSYTYVWSVGVPGYPLPPQPLTALGLLQKAVELGVGVVQIADNLPLDRLDEGELGALERCAGRLHVEIEVGTCGIEPDHLLRYLALARRFRSPILRVVLDSDDHRPEPDEVVATLRALLPRFESAGVCLAIENHDRFRSATLATIVNALGSPYVGICLDTANSLGCLESLETVLATLGRWVVNLHVKDFQVERLPHKKGFLVEGRPAGQGRLDVPGLLAEVRQRASGRDVNAIVELWPPPGEDPAASVAREEAWAAESVRFLRRFLPD